MGVSLLQYFVEPMYRMVPGWVSSIILTGNKGLPEGSVQKFNQSKLELRPRSERIHGRTGFSVLPSKFCRFYGFVFHPYYLFPF